MNDRYYLPNDTATLLTEDRLKKCKNLGLILDKYAPQTAIQKSEGKSIWLKSIESGSYIDTRLTESVYQRWLNTTTAEGAQHFSALTDWRMVVGLGGETVLETDLTLHHLYGIPFIPGSALKGLTRAYVTGEIYPSTDIDKDNTIVKQIFGSQESAGSVIFFDAIPVKGQATFVLDIMNSHYPNYYGEKKLPTNDQNPNPITFLTVTNTAFMFALAPRSSKDQDDVEQAKNWLQAALQKYGIGGKTSAGYGYFKDIFDEQGASTVEQMLKTAGTEAGTSSGDGREELKSPRIDPELQKAEGYRREIDRMPTSAVANQIQAYYQRWQQMKSDEARAIVARAIVEKVRQAGREKVSAEKTWHKELLAFIEKSGK